MEILDDADRERARPYDMETYKKWLKLGGENPYFNKAMCKYLAQAEKGSQLLGNKLPSLRLPCSSL